MQTCWCCRDQQKACRIAQASAEKKLEHAGPVEKERVASMPQRECSWQVRQSRLCQKEKQQSRLSKAPSREMGESQGEREPHHGEIEEDQSGSTERKRWTPQ